ncbi:MAG: cell division protein FtsX [Candidatus Dojkabacteria bacterium]|nr:MAG: cell division protein FtsX [Candidatus Dojkabacteria bacterium]
MRKFFRAVKIAFQYIYRNWGLSVASTLVMTLSFLIVSVFGIAFYGSTLLVQYVDSKPALTIFLRGDLSDEQRVKFEQLVTQTGLVREVSVKNLEFTKEDFAKKYPDPELIKPLETEEAKSFMPIIAFIYSDSQDKLQELINYLEKNEEFMKDMIDTKNVDRVGWYSFSETQASIIRETNRFISIVGTIVTIMLFVISSILIFITVKLTINYHRREIEIMDLVGADGWFIRFPFVLGGIIYGVVGAVLSTTLIIVSRNLLFETSQSLVPRLLEFFGEVPWPTIDNYLIIDFYIFTVGVGALIGALSSFIAILKYVKN